MGDRRGTYDTTSKSKQNAKRIQRRHYYSLQRTDEASGDADERDHENPYS